MQSKPVIRSVIVIVLLLGGILLVYGPQITPTLFGRAHSQSSEFSYTTDLDFWSRTDRERTVEAVAYFDLEHDLRNVPLSFGDWQGTEVPEDNEEVQILLDPEQYVLRFYRNSAGQHMWLSMIGGRSSQPFHPPDICYDADGWQYNVGSYPIALDEGGEIYGLWMEAEKTFPGEDYVTNHIVFYFYLFPNSQRDLAKDGIVLLKMTSDRYGDIEETLAVHADFVRNLFSSAY